MWTRRGLAVASLAVTLGAEVVAVAGLHVLGGQARLAPSWQDLAGWASSTSPEGVLAAAAWLAATAAGWWLLATSTLYLLVRVAGVVADLPAVVVSAVGAVTAPALRRLADRAVAAVLVGSTVLGGAPAAVAQVASPSPAASQQAEAGSEPPGVRIGSGPVPVPAPVSRPWSPWSPSPPPPRPPQHPAPARPPEASPRLPPSPPARREVQEPSPAPSPDAGRRTGAVRERKPSMLGGPEATSCATGPQAEGEQSHVVVAGQHLWGIAEQTLAGLLGRTPELDVLAAYWQHLIAANAERLRSGDPNLIYPGEVVLLPPLEDAEGS